MKKPTQPELTGPQLVFVYGTLKPGFHWHDELLKGRPGVRTLGFATTAEPHSLVVQGLPFLMKGGKHARRVVGVVLEVPSETVLTTLDRLERHPDWYRRELIDVIMDEGTKRAWCYFSHCSMQNARFAKLLDEGAVKTVTEFVR